MKTCPTGFSGRTEVGRLARAEGTQPSRAGSSRICDVHLYTALSTVLLGGLVSSSGTCFFDAFGSLIIPSPPYELRLATIAAFGVYNPIKPVSRLIRPRPNYTPGYMALELGGAPEEMFANVRPSPPPSRASHMRVQYKKHANTQTLTSENGHRYEIHETLLPT